MSDEQAVPNSKGPAPVRLPVATDPKPIPGSEVKPESVGTLAIEYRDGQPVIVVSGGRVIPGGIAVVDDAGNAVAAYTPNYYTAELGQRIMRPDYGCDLHSLVFENVSDDLLRGI
ncbi:hypothetical protein ACWGR4_38925 [Embleya sp. NPDC055664]